MVLFLCHLPGLMLLGSAMITFLCNPPPLPWLLSPTSSNPRADRVLESESGTPPDPGAETPARTVLAEPRWPQTLPERSRRAWTGGKKSEKGRSFRWGSVMMVPNVDSLSEPHRFRGCACCLSFRVRVISQLYCNVETPSARSVRFRLSM